MEKDTRPDNAGLRTWLTGLIVALVVGGALLVPYLAYADSMDVTRGQDLVIRGVIALIAIVVGSLIHNRLKKRQR
ncbi:MAG: hypothetical protein FJ319_03015 [SAR202 cluster bacterium]|nr:hypothetical protein [SAR202 cluster bacterium]